ncbi:MAG: hypothetical protein NTV07_02840 [Candidatus Omnitrophica bacterium]|nr:hypothetical protein [Candidatus Omnitrophota bacterium]
MFKNKTFKLAFLISVSWHLAIMFFVTIIVVPVTFKKARTYTVSFLGPILEKTAFDMMLHKGLPAKDSALYGQPLHFDEGKTASAAADLLVKKAEPFAFGDGGVSGAGNISMLEESKVFPAFQHTEDIIAEEEKPSPDNFKIEGPAAKREMLFAPKAPVVSRRIDQQQESFMVKLKMKIATSGSVKEAGLLVSSGYPDIDLAAINYCKKFQFAAVNAAAGTGAEAEWNTVSVRLKSK